MLAGVVLVYFPKPNADGRRLLHGMDHTLLHIRRITFAQESLRGPSHELPGWYPRELLGTPFWSNVSNFPFIPTRLIFFFTSDPLGLYTRSVLTSALLAAMFTYLYCRRIGLGYIGAATAGWTFACCGFYASRVLAGALGLLEAYPALPALMWLTEGALQSAQARSRWFGAWLAGMGLGCAAFSLAGHPQLSIYALGVSVLYVIIRPIRPENVMTLASMTLGVGCAAFALWPMWLLVRRSTRVLPLALAANDVAMPHWRIGALWFPWQDGWPENLARLPNTPLRYPSAPHFWDTVCYIGWMPWIGLVVLLVMSWGRRRLAQRPWTFWLVIALAAALLATPEAQRLFALVPGTFLRSPSRLYYIVSFVLAIVLGLFIDAALRSKVPKRAVVVLSVALLILIHGFDLYRHARAFVGAAVGPPQDAPEFERFVRQQLGDGRSAMDSNVNSSLNRRFDDVGWYDSIMLARPYRAIAAMTGAPAESNAQAVDGSTLSPRTLRATGVRLVIGTTTRNDLRAVPGTENAPLRYYYVDDSAPRALFYPLDRVEFLDGQAILQHLQQPDTDLTVTLMLPLEFRVDLPVREQDSELLPVDYDRPTSDMITLRTHSPRDGYVRVLESYDDGWRATVNGEPVKILPANHAFMAVAVPAGTHEILLGFATPGQRTGIVLSICSLVALVALSLSARRIIAVRGRNTPLPAT